MDARHIAPPSGSRPVPQSRSSAPVAASSSAVSSAPPLAMLSSSSAAATAASSSSGAAGSNRLLRDIEETGKLLRTFRALKERGSSRAELADLHLRVRALKHAQEEEQQQHPHQHDHHQPLSSAPSSSSPPVAVPATRAVSSHRTDLFACDRHAPAAAYPLPTSAVTAVSSSAVHGHAPLPATASSSAATGSHHHHHHRAEEKHQHDRYDQRHRTRREETTQPDDRERGRDRHHHRDRQHHVHADPSAAASTSNGYSTRSGLTTSTAVAVAPALSASAAPPAPSAGVLQQQQQQQQHLQQQQVYLNSVAFAIVLAEAHMRRELAHRWERRCLRHWANFKEGRVTIALRPPQLSSSSSMVPSLPQRWAEPASLSLPPVRGLPGTETAGERADVEHRPDALADVAAGKPAAVGLGVMPIPLPQPVPPRAGTHAAQPAAAPAAAAAAPLAVPGWHLSQGTAAGTSAPPLPQEQREVVGDEGDVSAAIARASVAAAAAAAAEALRIADEERRQDEQQREKQQREEQERARAQAEVAAREAAEREAARRAATEAEEKTKAQTAAAALAAAQEAAARKEAAERRAAEEARAKAQAAAEAAAAAAAEAAMAKAEEERRQRAEAEAAEAAAAAAAATAAAARRRAAALRDLELAEASTRATLVRAATDAWESAMTSEASARRQVRAVRDLFADEAAARDKATADESHCRTTLLHAEHTEVTRAMQAAAEAAERARQLQLQQQQQQQQQREAAAALEAAARRRAAEAEAEAKSRAERAAAAAAASCGVAALASLSRALMAEWTHEAAAAAAASAAAAAAEAAAEKEEEEERERALAARRDAHARDCAALLEREHDRRASLLSDEDERWSALVQREAAEHMAHGERSKAEAAAAAAAAAAAEAAEEARVRAAQEAADAAAAAAAAAEAAAAEELRRRQLAAEAQAAADAEAKRRAEEEEEERKASRAAASAAAAAAAATASAAAQWTELQCAALSKVSAAVVDALLAEASTVASSAQDQRERQQQQQQQQQEEEQRAQAAAAQAAALDVLTREEASARAVVQRDASSAVGVLCEAAVTAADALRQREERRASEQLRAEQERQRQQEEQENTEAESGAACEQLAALSEVLLLEYLRDAAGELVTTTAAHPRALAGHCIDDMMVVGADRHEGEDEEDNDLDSLPASAASSSASVSAVAVATADAAAATAMSEMQGKPNALSVTAMAQAAAAQSIHEDSDVPDNSIDGITTAKAANAEVHSSTTPRVPDAGGSDIATPPTPSSAASSVPPFSLDVEPTRSAPHTTADTLPQKSPLPPSPLALMHIADDVLKDIISAAAAAAVAAGERAAVGPLQLATDPELSFASTTDIGGSLLSSLQSPPRALQPKPLTPPGVMRTVGSGNNGGSGGNAGNGFPRYTSEADVAHDEAARAVTEAGSSPTLAPGALPAVGGGAGAPDGPLDDAEPPRQSASTASSSSSSSRADVHASDADTMRGVDGEREGTTFTLAGAASSLSHRPEGHRHVLSAMPSSGAAGKEDEYVDEDGASPSFTGPETPPPLRLQQQQSSGLPPVLPHGSLNSAAGGDDGDAAVADGAAAEDVRGQGDGLADGAADVVSGELASALMTGAPQLLQPPQPLQQQQQQQRDTDETTTCEVDGAAAAEALSMAAGLDVSTRTIGEDLRAFQLDAPPPPSAAATTHASVPAPSSAASLSPAFVAEVATRLVSAFLRDAAVPVPATRSPLPLPQVRAVKAAAPPPLMVRDAGAPAAPPASLSSSSSLISAAASLSAPEATTTSTASPAHTEAPELADTAAMPTSLANGSGGSTSSSTSASTTPTTSALPEQHPQPHALQPTPSAHLDDGHTDHKKMGSISEMGRGFTADEAHEGALHVSPSKSPAASAVAGDGIAGPHAPPLASLTTLVSAVSAPSEFVAQLRRQEAEKKAAAHRQNRFLTSRELALAAARFLTRDDGDGAAACVLAAGPTATLTARAVALVLCVGLLRAVTVENRHARRRAEEGSCPSARPADALAAVAEIEAGKEDEDEDEAQMQPGSPSARRYLSAMPAAGMPLSGSGAEDAAGFPVPPSTTSLPHPAASEALMSEGVASPSLGGDTGGFPVAFPTSAASKEAPSEGVDDGETGRKGVEAGDGEDEPANLAAGLTGLSPVSASPHSTTAAATDKLPVDWAAGLRGVSERVAVDFMDYASRRVLLEQGEGQSTQGNLRTSDRLHADALTRVNVVALFTQELRQRDVAWLAYYYVELAANGPRDRADPHYSPTALGEHNVFGRRSSGDVDGAGFDLTSSPRGAGTDTTSSFDGLEALTPTFPSLPSPRQVLSPSVLSPLLHPRNNSFLAAATAIHVRRSGLLQLVLEQCVSNVLDDLVGDTVGWLGTAYLRQTPSTTAD